MYILRKDSTHYLHFNTRKYTEQQIPNMHCMAKRLKKTCARQHHNIVEHLIPQSGRINMLLNTAGKAFHKILAAEIFLPFSHKSISKDRNWCVRCNSQLFFLIPINHLVYEMVPRPQSDIHQKTLQNQKTSYLTKTSRKYSYFRSKKQQIFAITAIKNTEMITFLSNQLLVNSLLIDWSINLGGTVNLKQGISLYSQTASTKLDSHHVYLWVLITAYELSFPL